MTRLLRVLVAIACVGGAVALPYPSAAGVTYVYDPAGRLTAVVDAAGNGAVYHYDAAGNPLSITSR
jgi:YD repeat-containing protein